MLEKQDILIWIKLLIEDNENLTVKKVAEDLGFRQMEILDALDTGEKEGVFDPDKGLILPDAFLNLLRDLPNVLYVEPEKRKKGMPTAISGPPLSREFDFQDKDDYVWANSRGRKQGLVIKPLHSKVPRLARRDKNLYEWLNLVETIRIGRPQERVLAFDKIEKRLRDLRNKIKN